MDRHPQPSALRPWWLMLGLSGVTLSFIASLLSGNWFLSVLGALVIVVFLGLLVRDRRVQGKRPRPSR